MLQFITHRTERYDEFEQTQLVLDGGCRWIQLRMKDATLDEVKSMAARIKKLCEPYEAALIIDDHVEIAKETGADGVHLGKNDMPPLEARELLGGEPFIGGTANTFDDIKQLFLWGVDYIGLGPFRYTTTKKNLSPVIGLDGYRNIFAQCRDNGIATPIVAIGGITADDIPGIMQAGATGIALSGTILQAENISKETEKIINLIKNY
ncbi:MAG: thiamine phosphate synthase [Bacteroidales bacterium]|nr:thiamine phosphate synthase [Bacteroidales bacterium]